MRHALSLVATRASGLKSQFGTMGKPFNAGIAASNGVEAASLARRGFLSCDDGIEGAQGFIATHADAPDFDTAWRDPPPRHFVFDRISYKLHACCHGTHAMLEALLQAKRAHGFGRDNIRTIEVKTHPRWLTVCDIKAPRTGIEVKFSYGFLAAMVVAGIDTVSEKTFTDGLCDAADLRSLANKVSVIGEGRLSDTQVELAIEMSDGRRIVGQHDLGAPIPLDGLGQSLRAKSQALLGAARAEKLWQAICNIERQPATALGQLLQDEAAF
jgi:2-methylcitrate dehydratase PrpD